MKKLEITASSRTGCVRTNNEDMLLIDSQTLRNGKLKRQADLHQANRFLVALADGMGGHNCGEVASADALENLSYFIADLPVKMTAGQLNEYICQWLKSINTMLESKGLLDPTYRNMGTTLVALLFYENEFYWMNCGDSRLYRLHNGQLTQISTDHSLARETGDRSLSSYITNCIGGGCKTSYIDFVKCTELIQSGDVLMLCSDGLNDMVDDNEICKLLERGFDADALCQVAEDAGGYDNVSVIVIRVDD